MIRISVPGKVHLIGEHSVVYGEPAIIGAISLYSKIKAEKNKKIKIIANNLKRKETFSLEEILTFTKELNSLWERGFKKKDFSELHKVMNKDKLNTVKSAIGKTLEILKINSGLKLEINSEIPMGSGLGSSASLSVGIPAAIAKIYEKDLTKEEINKIAYEIEKFNHGTPSGGDNSTCCFGGLIWFKRGNPNQILSLRKEIPYELKNFLLVYTEKPKKTTGELVSLVRNLKPEYREPRIKELGKLTREMRKVLKKKDFEKMKKIMNKAQKILSELGVSTKKIDLIHKKVKEIGGSAKLSGAGGGGIMICYHENKEKLENLIKDLGFKYMETELGVKSIF